MDVSGDDLAGIVDLFGAMDRPTLAEAVAELAFKRGDPYEPEDYEDAIAEAVASYHLVSVEVADGTDAAQDEDTCDDTDEDDPDELLVAGPVAFPTLPEGATDLPHILDAPEREVPDDQLAGAAAALFRRDAEAALDAGDDDRLAELLDVSYELEAWAGIDLSATREALDNARD